MNPCYEQLKTLTLNIKVHYLYSKKKKKKKRYRSSLRAILAEL